MEINYFSFSDAIAKARLEFEKPKFHSQRSELLNQLYTYYEKSYRKNMWTDYIAWLKQNRFKHSKEKVAQYKKVAYPKISVSSFCSFWLGHIPTDDLYYLVSIARDTDNRGGNFNKWLFWSLKSK